MARQSTTDINSQIDRQFKKPGARMHPMQITLFVLCLGIGIGVTAAFTPKNPLPAILGMLIGYFLMFSLQVGSQWERAVVLRMGKFHGLRGPGAFWVVPLVDTIPAWIDHRVQTTTYSAEQTLTKDTVPVDVDAVLFWIVWDAEKAALEVADYRQAIFWAAQTALRDVIGETQLSDLLIGRKRLDAELQKLIDERTTPWGVTVQAVEIRDIIIPEGLQDAMSRQAQAERERQARVILGDAEAQIAERFVQAGKAYEDHPTALHLRAMNMLYEGLKEKGALVVVPSTAVESMGLGTITGLTSLSKERMSNGANRAVNDPTL
ncbi:MAG TPA: slipin family protein [Chthonomonadaceae bacterium]|nr:slipin family protein [Chthonomonadaceae bacterium]